jgi:NitT/TauT family transport system substrate-binding protein
MLKSLAYATANPDEVRRIIPTYTKIDPSTAAKMALVGWSPQIDMPSIVALQRSMSKQGMLAKEVDLLALFPPAAVAGR